MNSKELSASTVRLATSTSPRIATPTSLGVLLSSDFTSPETLKMLWMEWMGKSLMDVRFVWLWLVMGVLRINTIHVVAVVVMVVVVVEAVEEEVIVEDLHHVDDLGHDLEPDRDHHEEEPRLAVVPDHPVITGDRVHHSHQLQQPVNSRQLEVPLAVVPEVLVNPHRDPAHRGDHS